MVDQNKIKESVREFADSLTPMEDLFMNRLIKLRKRNREARWWETVKDSSVAPITNSDKIDKLTADKCIESLRSKELKLFRRAGGIFGSGEKHEVMSRLQEEIDRIFVTEEIIELKKGKDYEIAENEPISKGRLR